MPEPSAGFTITYGIAVLPIAVMGNPGREITVAIAPYADIFVTAEMDSTKYSNRYNGSKAAFENNAANAKHIMHIIHSADPAQYAEIIKLSRGYNAGWLYITDDVMSNPYDQLPTNFTALATAIAKTATNTANSNNASGATGKDVSGSTDSQNNGAGNQGTNSAGTNNGNSQHHTALPVSDNSATVSASVSTNTVSGDNSAQTNKMTSHEIADKSVGYIPRSKVDLDLTKNARALMYQNFENPEDHNVLFNVAYLGSIDSRYEDDSGHLNYDSTAQGIILSVVTKINQILLGGGMSYQQANVEYQKQFAGIEEKIRAYQLLFSGKYLINDNVDITSVLTYSNSRHKFKTIAASNELNNAKYHSKIWDWNTRLGYKLLFSKGYIKPYVGVGVTNIREGNIDKIGAGKTSSNLPNASVGIYGQLGFNAFELFGNIEYEKRLDKKSSHRTRSYTSSYDIAEMKYRTSTVNAGVGIGYRITDAAKLNMGYEVRETKNNLVRVGFEYKF